MSSLMIDEGVVAADSLRYQVATGRTDENRATSDFGHGVESRSSGSEVMVLNIRHHRGACGCGLPNLTRSRDRRFEQAGMALHLAVAVCQVQGRPAFSIHNVWLRTKFEQHLHGLEVSVPSCIVQHRIPLIVLLVHSPWLLLQCFPQSSHVAPRRSPVQGPWRRHSFATFTATQVRSHPVVESASKTMVLWEDLASRPDLT
eukprot:756615-Hanusia_phi.AAC.1